MVLKGRMDRAIARMLLPDWAKSAWSATRIIRGLKSAGLTYRRQDMLSDIRAAKDAADYGQTVVTLKQDQVIGKEAMNETILRKPRQYKLGFHSVVRDVETGGYRTEYTNIYVDNTNTKGGWEDQFIDEMNTIETNRYKQFISTQLIYIEKNIEWVE